MAWIVGFLAARFLLISGRELVEAPALERVNYRGRVIFTEAWLVIVMAVVIVEVARSGCGASGFRGHLRALAHGRLTSGMIKLLGGAAVALVLAAAPGFVTWQRLFADAVLIALAANLANLLDRAPGRVIKYSLLAYAPLAFVAGAGPVGVAAAPVMGAAPGRRAT